MEYERTDIHGQSVKRARETRWNAPGRSKVTHPQYGSVVVPHSSNLCALMNAAEYWGCGWMDIRDAEVWAAGPGDGPLVKPREFCKTRKT